MHNTRKQKSSDLQCFRPSIFVIAAFRVFKCKITFWVNGCCGRRSLMFTVAIFTGENRKAWLSVFHIRSTIYSCLNRPIRESHQSFNIIVTLKHWINKHCQKMLCRLNSCQTNFCPFFLYDLTHHDQMSFCDSPWAVFSQGVGRCEILHVPSSFKHEKTRRHIGTWCTTSIFGR